MSNEVFNIVLAVASGCISIGVLVLIRVNFLISSRLNDIDVKLGQLIVRVDMTEKQIDRHEDLILKLQTSK